MDCFSLSNFEFQEAIKNEIVPSVMACIPEETACVLNEDEAEISQETKVNGGANIENNIYESEYSSESDALVIDEGIVKKPFQKQKRITESNYNRKAFKEIEVITHSNPFFNESLYELTQQHQKFQLETNISIQDECIDGRNSKCNSHKFKKAKDKSPKREYAQYLGLQPTVQFKCSKCCRAGFETLADLNEHVVHCDAISAVQQMPQESTSSFKLTRKVFLCSACGTYYENWNLYLHMLELHKRFICLYCLGMFSASNDLCHHIQTRHNLQPGHKNNLDEFFNVYNEPCYVVCCECNELFNEGDNFFYHNCVKSGHSKSNVPSFNQKLSSKNKTLKVQIRPEYHVTGDSGNSLNSVEDTKRHEVSHTCFGNLENKTQMETLHQTHNNIENINKIDATDMLQSENLTSESEKCLEGIEKQNKTENIVAKDVCDNVINTLSCGELDHQAIAGNEAYLGFKEKYVESEAESVKNNLLNTASTYDSEKEIAFSIASEDSYSVVDNIISIENYNPMKNFGYSHKNNCEDVSPILLNADQSTEIDTKGENLVIENKGSASFSENQDYKIFCQEDVNTFMKQKEREILYENHVANSEIECNELEEYEVVDTRKVPKLSLKLPKLNLYEDRLINSDDSEKLSGIDQIESEQNICTEVKAADVKNQYPFNNLQVAGPDVNIVELQLEQPLDKFESRILLQKCLTATAPTCIYCNHARKIAVNGKQLALHTIAEHRYTAVVNSITAEELMPETFVIRIVESLDELEDVFFNLESGIINEGVTFSHIFECFQCRYSTTVHKELYLHNRKLHTKNLLLCIMCKSVFYSYSELICHLCPGVYILDYDIQFRCCMCVSDILPSAFRLMVHLRKRHHVCDVCLELCNNQYKLSNHVWKHKLHHFCYRCGIAYRNKPDITRHLFWKHGTESVLCKKCLQKKWPHVYHFCVPPNSFLCDECNFIFTRAVSLKVHKRLHNNERPHLCIIDGCKESFISKKLLLKHKLKHEEPVEESRNIMQESCIESKSTEESYFQEIVDSIETVKEDKIDEKHKLKVDVYNLPELNLSESDSESDHEVDTKENKVQSENTDRSNTRNSDDKVLYLNILKNVGKDVHLPDKFNENETLNNISGKNSDFQFGVFDNSPPILENIWDNFKNYQAEKEKIDHFFIDKDKLEEKNEGTIEHKENVLVNSEDALLDHDYCFLIEPKLDTSITEVKPDLSQRVDHDYCSPKRHITLSLIKTGTEKDRSCEKTKTNLEHSESTSSDSDSATESSTCTCGSNCSCSSSSVTSSSSSDMSDSDSSTEEGRRKQQLKRELRRDCLKSKKTELLNTPVVIKHQQNSLIAEMPIQESDLDTTETETDEEFYDKQPQKLAKRILEEKRNQLLSEMGPIPNDTWLDRSRPSTPSLPKEIKTKKKSKSKKKKKHKNEKKEQCEKYKSTSEAIYYQCYQPSAPTAPITLTISRNSPVSSQPVAMTRVDVNSKLNESTTSRIEDLKLRASKRRRVPNKFYGYSSDEELEKAAIHISKWRKTETHLLSQSTMTVPPITIKTAPISSQAVIEPPLKQPVAQTGQLRLLPKPSIASFKMRPRPFISSAVTVEHPAEESASDSNESSSEENDKQIDKPPQPQLYCYCRCPYDEVSEMIGCDANDCAIEWFHFECVGIMVPPKGQWYCPDCRKKKQQRREFTQI